MNPPIAKKKEHKYNIHNYEVKDEYYWLRERENQEVLDYLHAENAYTNKKMEHTKDLQTTLYDEMVARLKEDDEGVPVKLGDYYYYSRTVKGKNYKIECRKKGNLEAKEEILLDINELAEGKAFCKIKKFVVSSNHKLVAYAADYDGSEVFTIYIKDLETGQLLAETIEKTAGTIVWANDNKTFFYTTLDEMHRPYRLYRHEIGTKEDVLVYEEKNDGFFLGAFKTKSSQYIQIYLGSKVTTEIHLLDANHPTGEFKCFKPRTQNIEYAVTHHENDFYILTNENALNFKIYKTSIHKTERSNWVEVIAHDEAVLLNDLIAFKNHLVVYGRKNGLKFIQILNPRTNESHDISFEDEVYTIDRAKNPDYNTNVLRFEYSSMVAPRTVYDYNMADRSRILKKETEVLGGFDKVNYETKRLFATASDGTQIPISIVYKKGLKLDGTNPCLLYGYGSYGHSLEPYFSTLRISLLNRGFVYAIGHIRGGQEMGRHWYENGKFLDKRNTFTDFIACGEHLVQSKYTNPDKLSIMGGSAGGLLMGAVMNLRPDLFKAVVAAVPFVDVMNTMLDETIPLTVIEYEEWGNPNDKVYYDYMRSYSPYDNIEAKIYPNVLITAGLNDPRVQYWEPAKWTAKLRDTKTDDNLLLLKTNMDAGHGGASGRYEFIKEIAFEYAFLIDMVG